MRARPGKARADRILATLAIALIPIVAVHAWHAIVDIGAVDFYHLWGVPVARDALGSDPYAATQAYAAHLNAVADSSTSATLHVTNALRRAILPTGTPSFYALFSVLPRDFDRALACFVFAQYLAFIGGVALLARTYGLALAPAAALGAGCALLFAPFSQDVNAGNVNSFQLLALAILVWLSIARARLPAAAFGYAYPALVGALAVLKPNIAWILALLALHYAIVAERRLLAQALFAAVGAALLVGCAGMLYFGGRDAWTNWFAYALGMNGGKVVFTVSEGNQSMVEFLAELSPRIGLARAQLGMSGLILASFGFFALRGSDEVARASGIDLLGDARFAAACGAVLMLAASPLVWPHYHVLAILPLAWLASGRAGRAGYVLAALAAAAYVMPVTEPLWPRRFLAAGALLTFLAWIPLAAGLCAALARPRLPYGR